MYTKFSLPPFSILFNHTGNKLKQKVLLVATIGMVLMSDLARADWFDDYLGEIQSISRRRLTLSQIKHLRHYYNAGNSFELSPQQLEAQHGKFTQFKKEGLRNEWRQETGIIWPTYSKSVKCKVNGSTVCAHKGWAYDLHHIIPQIYNGPHTWWNSFPLTKRQHNRVHGKDSMCTFLFPNSAGIRTGGY